MSETKEIRIDKTGVGTNQPQKVAVRRSDLDRETELTKDEMAGLLTMKLNEMIQDKLVNEFYYRKAKYEFDLARSTGDSDKYSATMTKIGEILAYLDNDIKTMRMLISEVKDDRYTI